jgi:hypothetical protein
MSPAFVFAFREDLRVEPDRCFSASRSQLSTLNPELLTLNSPAFPP